MTTATGSRMEHSIGGDGLLAIHIRDGRIQLHGVDGGIVRVRDVNDRDLADTLGIDPGEGSLSLRSGPRLDFILGPRGGRPGGRRAPELDIEVPWRASIVIEAASGDVEVDGLLGDQRYRTASGDVTLRAVGGRLSVEVVSGDVDITARDTADVIARTVSGDIALRAATLASVIATTTSGDLKLAGRLSGAGPFRIDTVSGDALLAPAGDVQIQMNSLTGDLISDVDGPSVSRGRHSLTIGRSGPLVTVRSMSGDLRVVRPIPITEATGSALGSAPAPATPPPAPAGPQPAPVPEAPANPAISAAHDEARLRILQSLEHGEIDVAEAGRRLETLDAGEPSGRPGGLDA